MRQTEATPLVFKPPLSQVLGIFIFDTPEHRYLVMMAKLIFSPRVESKKYSSIMEAKQILTFLTKLNSANLWIYWRGE
jgi:hypothetical protein